MVWGGGGGGGEEAGVRERGNERVVAWEFTPLLYRRLPKNQNQKPLEKTKTTAKWEKKGVEEDRHDPTLLAVIGVLDEIKAQSNVTWRIRAGGLWGPSLHLRARSRSPNTGNDPSPAPVFTPSQSRTQSRTRDQDH
jgi:hypothetical protein